MTILNDLASSLGQRNENANRAVADRVQADLSLLDELAGGLSASNVKLVGDCAEVFTMIAEHSPQAVAPYLPHLIPLLNSKNGRVRWEAMHALAFTARHVPVTMAELLPVLMDTVRRDPAVIVPRYALEALGEYAATGPQAAQAVFPFLVEALQIAGGRHAGVVIDGMAKAAQADPSLAAQVIDIAQRFKASDTAVVRSAARRALKQLDSGTRRRNG
ncbi:MAG: hypothetical protein JXM73_23625 [Anaerolineae bacterium]|nr:hypothetical protein [Anaerolineae bacterium]